jgi:hypothetical protein
MAEYRRQRVLFVILGVLVVVFLGRTFMKGGGGGDSGSQGTTLTTVSVPSFVHDDAHSTETTTPTVPPDDNFDVSLSRNPFEPSFGSGESSGGAAASQSSG